MAQIKTQSALIITGPAAAEVMHDLTIPSPDYRQVLVKTHAVGLNTPDVLALDLLGRSGAGLGFDFAGEVVEVGEALSESWKIGDRVAGFVHGCHAANYSAGAFRDFILADADLLIRIPDKLKYVNASALGMGVSTAAQALYQSLHLPLPTNTPIAGLKRSLGTPDASQILIYGASTATGAIAVQLAKLSGLRVIATCSQANIPWIKSLGADEVVDYRDPRGTQKIHALGRQDGISNVLDCVAKPQTAQFCYQCFIEAENLTRQPVEYIYAALMPMEDSELPGPPKQISPSASVINKCNMVYTCFGRRFTIINEQVKIKRTWEPSKTDREFMASFFKLIEKHLETGKLQPIPVEVKEGGLDNILDGIAALREGCVHGKKLVYTL